MPHARCVCVNATSLSVSQKHDAKKACLPEKLCYFSPSFPSPPPLLCPHTIENVLFFFRREKEGLTTTGNFHLPPLSCSPRSKLLFFFPLPCLVFPGELWQQKKAPFALLNNYYMSQKWNLFFQKAIAPFSSVKVSRGGAKRK